MYRISEAMEDHPHQDSNPTILGVKEQCDIFAKTFISTGLIVLENIQKYLLSKHVVQVLPFYPRYGTFFLQVEDNPQKYHLASDGREIWGVTPDDRWLCVEVEAFLNEFKEARWEFYEVTHILDE